MNKSKELDYEKTPVYKLFVNVHDGSLPGVAQVLTIDITDVNEIPEFTKLPASVTVPEDAVSAADIFTVSHHLTVQYVIVRM